MMSIVDDLAGEKLRSRVTSSAVTGGNVSSTLYRRFPDNHFPGQDISRTDVSRTSYAKEFSDTIMCVNTSSIGLVKR